MLVASFKMIFKNFKNLTILCFFQIFFCLFTLIFFIFSLKPFLFFAYLILNGCSLHLCKPQARRRIMVIVVVPDSPNRKLSLEGALEP